MTGSSPAGATDAALDATQLADAQAMPVIEGSVTYYKDIKTLLDAKCVRCHVAGTIAPFTLACGAA